MKNKAISSYDVAEHLRTPHEIALYLQACVEESNGDIAFIARALDDIVRTKGITLAANGPESSGV